MKPARALALALLLPAVALAQGEKSLVFDAPPQDWKVEATKGMMAPKVAYQLPAAEGDAEGARVTLHHFGGMGGSVDDNIKRWCGQFKDASGAALDPAKLKKETLEVNGLKVTLLDLAGTYQAPSFGGPAQAAKPGWTMVAGIVETEDGLYFARLLGPDKTIAKHREAYLKWLKSARWAEPEKKPEGK